MYNFISTGNQQNLSYTVLASKVLEDVSDDTLLFGLKYVPVGGGPNDMMNPDLPVVLEEIPEASNGGSGIMKGQRVDIRRRRTLPAVDGVEGNPAQLQTVTEDIIPLFVNRYKECSIAVTERAKVQTSIGDMSDYARMQNKGLARAIETDIYAVFPTFTNVLGDGTTNVQISDLATGTELLRNLGFAQSRGVKVFGLFTSESVTTFQLDGQLNQYQLGGSRAVQDFNEGWIGATPFGVKVAATNSKLARSGNTAFQCLLAKGGDPIFMGMAIKPSIRQEKVNLAFANAQMAVALYGVNRGRDEAGITMNYTSLNGRPAAAVPLFN